MLDRSYPASVHTQGGAPGSQETSLLDPANTVDGVDSILLTGGSAFGLAAASGVRQYLEEKGRGFKVADRVVPIVPAAVIFDLSTGDGSIRPGAEQGFAACLDAENFSDKQGAVGAGAGATVGKYMGVDQSSPGGLASLSMKIDSEVMIGALMVANCYGQVVDPQSGKVVAGPKLETGEFQNYLDADPPPPSFGATAIGVVVTDAKLTKAEAKRVAVMAHDGLARSVYPSHTPYDGDMIFVVSTGQKEMEISRLGAWAAFMVERAMVAAVSY
jgi:L-aminopeptidase/D-esterase-like protein